MGTDEQGANENNQPRTWLERSWRTLCIGAIFIALFLLMRLETWPFQRKAVAIGQWLDIVEFLFSDRVFVGVFRLALIGLGFYAVLSMASQVLRDRWITGLSKDGFHIDEIEQVNDISEQIIKERDDALIKVEELEGVAKEHQEKTSQLEIDSHKLNEDLVQINEGFNQAEQDRDWALAIIDQLQEMLASQTKRVDDYLVQLEAPVGNRDD